MSKPVGHNSPKSSRLLRNLGELGVLKSQPAEKQFGSRLGRLIDLSDSIALADTLKQVSKPVAVDEQVTGIKQGERLKTDFLERRSSMVSFIVRSFSDLDTVDAEVAQAPFGLPRLSDEILGDEGFKPYQRFYALHQSEMELQVGRFLALVREQIGESNSKLTRIVTLDSALFETLQSYCRKQLAQVSVLLEKRFQTLKESQIVTGKDDVQPSRAEDWLLPTGWLSVFYREMQNLLLAELDLRLQPLLGLIEACEYEELNQR